MVNEARPLQRGVSCPLGDGEVLPSTALQMLFQVSFNRFLAADRIVVENGAVTSNIKGHLTTALAPCEEHGGLLKRMCIPKLVEYIWIAQA